MGWSSRGEVVGNWGEMREYAKKRCGPNVVLKPSVERLKRRQGGRRERGMKPAMLVGPLFEMGCWLVGVGGRRARRELTHTWLDTDRRKHTP